MNLITCRFSTISRCFFNIVNVGNDVISQLIRRHIAPVLTLFKIITAIALLIGCTGGENPNNSTNSEYFLETLGVNVNPGGRLDHTGVGTIPDSYSPIGASRYLYKPAEFFAFGFQETVNASQMKGLKFVDEEVDMSFPGFNVGMNTIDGITDIWDDVSLPVTTAFNANGEGKESILLLYKSASNALVGIVYSYNEFNKEIDQTTVLTQTGFNISELNVIAVDTDGDATDEFIIAISQKDQSELIIAHAILVGNQLQLDTINLIENLGVTEETNVEMASGNIDYDRSEEWGLTLNIAPNKFESNDTSTSYYIFDDSNSNFALIKNEPHIVDNNKISKVAGIAFADMDSDGLDEVIIGGVSNIAPDPNNVIFNYLITILDDNEHNLALLNDEEISVSLDGSSGIDAPDMRYVHVKPVNIDYLPNDSDSMAEEVLINSIIVDDIVSKDCSVDCIDVSEMSLNAYLKGDSGGNLTNRSSTVTVGDLNADSRDDVLIFSHLSTDNRPYIYSDSDGDGTIEDNPTFMASYFDLNDYTANNPILVAANINSDSVHVAIEASAESELIFTDPMIVAVLAASPCEASLGQNTDNCVTSYGSSKSNATTEETGTQITTSTSVGIGVEFSIFGVGASADVDKTVSKMANHSLSNAYEYIETVTYTTGGIEDVIVFTTVPFDEFTYIVTMHPEESVIGETLMVRLPRKPITVATELSFYNQHVEGEGLTIGNEVFVHTPGDVSSYHTANSQAIIMNTHSGIKSSSTQSVGQGTGTKSIQLEVSTDYSESWGSSQSVDISIAGKLGIVKGGYSSSDETSRAITISRGTAKIYSGTVANMDSESFSDSSLRYQFGLFNYRNIDTSGQEYEVIDYWIE